MVDGATLVSDIQNTDSNREIVRAFLAQVLINGLFEKLDHYIADQHFTEHNPHMADGISALRAALSAATPAGSTRIRYNKVHRLLTEGNFVLSVCKGSVGGIHSSFYDLFRVAESKLTEHWDTTEAIPPQSEWKNDNGKF